MQRLASGLWTRGGTVPRSVRALQLLTGLLIASFVASTIFRAHGTSIPFFDVWVENIAYACCALMCVWRAIARRPGRWGWGALGVGLVCFTVGSVVFTAVVQYWTTIPSPSIADFSFLSDYPLAFLGIGLLVRETVPNISKTILVDALIGRSASLLSRPRWSSRRFPRGSTATSRLSRPTSRIRSGTGFSSAWWSACLRCAAGDPAVSGGPSAPVCCSLPGRTASTCFE